jgi:hypothetical protein
MGHSVSILTCDKSFEDDSTSLKSTYDVTLVKDQDCFDNFLSIPNDMALHTFYRLYNFLRDRHHATGAQPNGESHTPETHMPSARQGNLVWKIESVRSRLLVRSFRKHTLDSLTGKYDVVISSYSPSWPHLVAETLKRADPSQIWIADYRDPVYSKSYYSTRDAMDFAGKHTDSASMILTVSDYGQDLHLPKRCPPCRIISNGFDPDDYAHTSEQSQTNSSPYFDLTYTGKLYSEGVMRRDISPVVRILNELITEERMSAKDIRFIYAGPSSAVLSNQLSHENPLFQVIDKGLVSREKAMELQASAAMLVLLSWNTAESKCGPTGKIYEYFLQQRPILASVSGELAHSTVRTMLEETRSGITLEDGDQSTQTSVSNYIMSCYADWKKAGRTFLSPDTKAIGKYSYPSIASELNDLLESLVSLNQN